jgi:hypothetical protein
MRARGVGVTYVGKLELHVQGRGSQLCRGGRVTCVGRWCYVCRGGLLHA